MALKSCLKDGFRGFEIGVDRGLLASGKAHF